MAIALLAGMKVQQARIDKLDGEINASSTSSTASTTNAWSVDQTTGKINAMGDINLQGHILTNVASIAGNLGKWSIDQDGTIIAVKIITDEMIAQKLTVGSPENPTGITLYDEITKEPYCLRMRNGDMVSDLGTCSSSAGPVSSPTPTPSNSATPSPSETPTPSPTPSASPVSSSSPAPSPTPSNSPTPSSSPSPSPSASPSPTPSSTPVSSPSPTPSPSATPAPTPSPTSAPSASPSPLPSPTAEPSPTP